MTKKNDTYWRERFEQLEDALHSDIEKLLPDIDRLYKTAQADIEKEIRAWYQRLADNNGVSMAEARKLLSAGELQEFKWSVEEYIKHGKKNAIDQRWTKQLENASAKFHISRLEALKLHIQQSIEQVYGNQLDALDESMRELYQEGYYRTAFEVQKGFNIGLAVAAVDQNKLDKVIRKPWAPDGKNFSERIWGSKTKLINEVHTEISRMCITGEAPDRAIKSIAKKMNTSRYNAGRLVMTEAAYFGSESQKDCFNDLGVERYEICATLDSHTSDICRKLDGKVFDMKNYEAGVTAPPFHVFCRSCTCPYFDDEFTAGEMRAARGEDGKTYYVPADMKYEEWKEKYAGKTPETVEKTGGRGIINMKKLKSVKTGGLRNETPLTEEQIKENIDYAVSLGMPKERIRYGEHYNTSYGSNFDMLYIGTDVYPGKQGVAANERISNKGAIAHEIIGHRETVLKGTVLNDRVLDEAQASIRAARYAHGLLFTERIALLRDAAERLKNEGLRLKEVKAFLDIQER